MNTDGHKDIPNEIIFPLGEAAISSNVIAEVSGTKAKIEKAISDSKVAREHSNFNDHTKREAELHAEATGEANMKIDSMQYAREIFLRKYPGCRPLLHSHTERWEDFLKLAEDAWEKADSMFRYGMPTILPFTDQFPDKWDDLMTLWAIAGKDALWLCIEGIPWAFSCMGKYPESWDDLMKISRKAGGNVNNILLAFSAALPHITSTNYQLWVKFLGNIADDRTSAHIVWRIWEIRQTEEIRKILDHFLLGSHTFFITVIRKLLIAKDAWLLENPWEITAPLDTAWLSFLDQRIDARIRELFEVTDAMEEKIKRPEFIEAFAMSMSPAYNKKEFKDILTHYLSDDVRYMEELSGNTIWVSEIWLEKEMGVWAGRHEKIIHTQGIWSGKGGKDIQSIKIYKETDPVRILMMGNWMDGSCLTYWSANSCYWSTAVNALDINKAVFYIEDSDGEIIGRVPVAIDDNGDIVRFLLYTKGDVNRSLSLYFNTYIRELASLCGLGINGDLEKVRLLNGEAWHENPVREIK